MEARTSIAARTRAALSTRGAWAACACVWCLWVLLDFAFHRLYALTQAAGAVALPLGLCVLYYAHFNKCYATTAVAVAAVRGGARWSFTWAGFGRVWRTVQVHFWIGWKVFCASAPFLFLNVLFAWYDYRVAYCLRVDHPDWEPREVVEESARLTRRGGGRLRLFAVDALFAGVLLLLLAPGVYCVWLALEPALASCPPDQLLLALNQASAGAQVSAGALRDIGADPVLLARGALMVNAATVIVPALFVQPYWTAALAAVYEDLLDRDEADGPAGGPGSKTEACEANP